MVRRNNFNRGFGINDQRRNEKFMADVLTGDKILYALRGESSSGKRALIQLAKWSNNKQIQCLIQKSKNTSPNVLEKIVFKSTTIWTAQTSLFYCKEPLRKQQQWRWIMIRQAKDNSIQNFCCESWWEMSHIIKVARTICTPTELKDLFRLWSMQESSRIILNKTFEILVRKVRNTGLIQFYYIAMMAPS